MFLNIGGGGRHLALENACGGEDRDTTPVGSRERVNGRVETVETNAHLLEVLVDQGKTGDSGPGPERRRRADEATKAKDYDLGEIHGECCLRRDEDLSGLDYALQVEATM